ncbi:hypothetical protein [Natrinema caseinilyticum]|uniref:hypothetical protein n=1 Tax=Natrinema caseinilyticum TaxID=2961570 RepID=UPI0020C4F6B8|nr:hypothetical protein [Natrinema caseinilyticum]
MPSDDLLQEIDASLEKSDDEFEADLPRLFDAMDGNTEALVRNNPATVRRVIDRIGSVDFASVVSDTPEIARLVQELIWTRTAVLVESSPDVRATIDDDITASLEATDCPMTGYLVVDEAERTMYGGPGRLDDPMLEITGPAETLVGLIVGTVHPIRGYIQQQYDMDGPVHKGTRLAPIMDSLSEQVRPEPAETLE